MTKFTFDTQLGRLNHTVPDEDAPEMEEALTKLPGVINVEIEESCG